MSQVSVPKAPESLAERFWSIARQLEPLAPDESGMPDPAAVVRHVLRVLDALAAGQQGDGITVHTLNFIALLRQYELRGDLAYASPEQARGEQLDERSIVFSVGVLLFEKLTGRHPFGDKTNPRRLARIQKGEIASGVNYFPAVPAGLRAVLMKAMGPFPEERYEGLAALRSELERFIAEASRPTPKGTTPPVLRRVPPPAPRPSKPIEAEDSDGPTRLMTGPAPVASASNVPAARPLRPSVIPVPLPDEARARSIFDLPQGMKDAGSLPAAAPAPAPSAWRRRLAPLGYLAVGAAVATGFFALSAGKDGEKTTVGVAPATAAPVAPAPAPAPEAPPPAVVAAPAPAPAPAAPAAFDPRAAGDKALALAATCFTSEQLATGAHFGVSVVFAKPDGLAKRLYFAGEEISPAERTCLTQAFVGQLAAGPLDKATVVEYRLHVKASGSELKFHLPAEK